MKTVLETLTSGTEYLGQHGVDNPRLNMEHLVAHILGCNRMQLYLDFERPLPEQQLAPLRELLRRRGRREPLQHLIGTVEFRGHDFRTDRRALIPRPETETLVEKILDRCRDTRPERILDMGTGSGVIGLSLAAEWKDNPPGVTLVDISGDALALARENSGALLPDRDPPVTFLESDLWQRVEPGGTFDLLVANLPYVAASGLDQAEPELQHDPREALAGGGSDGTAVIERFLDGSTAHAAPDALLALEIAVDQGERVAALAEQHHWSSITIESDLEQRPRFLFARHHT